MTEVSEQAFDAGAEATDHFGLKEKITKIISLGRKNHR